MDVAQCHPHLQLIDRLESGLLAMERLEPQRCFRDSGLDPLCFAESVLCPALDRIGTAWQAGNVALSQVYMSGRISEELLEAILPAGGAPPVPHPPIAIAVLDDGHPLGKRIVCSFLRANGFQLTDYGSIGVAPLLARLVADGIRILDISTLMLPSALRVREVREGLDAAGLPVRLVVGGAPFRLDPGLWREAGATAVCYFDPLSSPDLAPREQYPETGAAVARATLSRIKGPSATHLASGRALTIIDELALTGTAAVGVSCDEDLAQLKEACRGRLSLIGNLNGIAMRSWSPATARSEVRRAIAQAGAEGGFILADNHGEIPWQTPDEVLHAIADEVRSSGRYPLQTEVQP
jgi:methanogenic corrinoid protein MtbC1